jgi:hypothetical protein
LPDRAGDRGLRAKKPLDKGVLGAVTLAVNGSPRRPANSANLPFNFDEALRNCVWVSGT